MRLIVVNTLYFTCQNVMINFMVTLFIRSKFKWAISSKYQLHLYLARFQNFDIQDFLGSPYIHIYICIKTDNSSDSRSDGINNKKLRSDNLVLIKLLTLRKYSGAALFCSEHMEHSWTSLEGIFIITDNNYKPLMFQQVYVFFKEPIKIDELIKLTNQ